VIIIDPGNESFRYFWSRGRILPFEIKTDKI
jgi:hypothetical protein